MFKINLLLMVLTFAFLVGCNDFKKDHSNSNRISITIQYLEGCPDAKELIKNVEDAISDIKNKVNLLEILIENGTDAKKHNFRGSPTLLINDEDFEKMKVPEKAEMNCRLYSGGIPGSEEIEKRLQKIIGGLK